uniref:Uncharacterized protein n=1 Tax=Anthurium amnicola TaxID=1678845 RepID=A0A1D1XUW1_9ARAE
MQSPSSILEYPRSSSKTTSKQNLETFIKQQKTDKSNNTTITDIQTSEDKAQSTGATKMFYKLTELLAYTSSYTTSAISETYNTLMAGGTEPEYTSRKKSYNNSYHGDVMQIADDSDGAYYNEEISDGEIEYNDKKIDRKNEAKWSENDEEYEPPPPYDSSWVMPKRNSEENRLTDAPMSTSPKQVNFEAPNVESKPISTTEDTNSTNIAQTIPIPKRRQIRVRRPRRLIRRKSASTEVSTPRGGGGGKYDDPEELLLKVNDKLSDMIAQGRAALTSTVDVTEVEILLAEEREKEERIMKEVGAGRKGRKNVADLDYLSSMSDGNLSSPEFFDYGYNAYSGHGSGFASPSGYDTPDYPSHGHYNTPSQFGSPGMQPYHHQTQGGYYPYGPNNNHKFENDFPNHYYEQSSNGYAEPAIPKVFGNGPISAGFGGPVKFGGRYVGLNNNGGFGHYGHNFGFGSNGFRGNVFNNNRGFY